MQMLNNEQCEFRCTLGELNLLLSADGTSLINGLSNDIHDSAQGLRSHRDSDGGTSVINLLATDQTLCTIHSNSADCVLT